MMTNDINVMYLVSSLKESGPINQLYELINELPLSIEKNVLALSNPDEESRAYDFEQLGASVSHCGIDGLSGLATSINSIKQKIEDINPSIIHSHGFRPDLVASLFIDEMITISTIHNVPHYDYPKKYGHLQGHIMAKAHEMFLNRINYPVACSQFVSEVLLKECGIKSTYIRNGIDKNLPNRMGKLQTPGMPCLKDNIPTIVTVGSLIKRKNPTAAITGFLSANFSDDAELLIVGDGPLKSKCRSLSSAHDNIHVLGRVPDVYPYLYHSDYYLSASTAEGLPISVLEAMAFGLPICLSNIGPHEEILSQNPQAGITFDSNDPSDLSSSLDKLSQGNYDQQSKSSRSIIDNELNSEKMAEKYNLLYEGIAVQ